MIVVEVFRVIFVTEDKNYCRLRQDNKILFWLRWKNFKGAIINPKGRFKLRTKDELRQILEF